MRDQGQNQYEDCGDKETQEQADQGDENPLAEAGGEHGRDHAAVNEEAEGTGDEIDRWGSKRTEHGGLRGEAEEAKDDEGC